MATISLPAKSRGARYPLGARLRARLLPAALDAALAAGANPGGSPALAARAELLVSPRFRRMIATGLERTVADAAETPSPLSPRAPLRREAVLEAAAELTMLATLVREADATAPCGVARAGLLLTDGFGPLFSDQGHDGIRRAARAAAEAL